MDDETAVEVRPMPTYIVRGTLKHDGRVYRDGEQFRAPDEELVTRLRAAGALALPSEVLPPDVVQAQTTALATENERLRASEATLAQRLAELEAQLAATGPAPKGK